MIEQKVTMSGALVTESGNTAALGCAGMFNKFVYFNGISAGSGQVQTSPDGGTNWHDTGDAAVASGRVEVPEGATHIRVDGTGLTCSGILLCYFIAEG
jgi:hypothetical protein